MSGEITGAKDSNLTCIPKTDSTVTEAVWRQRIKDGGWFVQFDEGTTTADEIGVTGLAADAVIALGRVIGATGSGDKFRITVETEGVRGYAQGGATGAFASTDYGDRMKADSDGKLVVDNAATSGNMFLVGGTKDEPAVAWRGQVKA